MNICFSDLNLSLAMIYCRSWKLSFMIVKLPCNCVFGSLVFRRKILCDAKPKPVSRKFLIYAPIMTLWISYAYGFVDLRIGRPLLRLLPLTSSCLVYQPKNLIQSCFVHHVSSCISICIVCAHLSWLPD